MNNGYEINYDTLAIMDIEENKSKIYEYKDTFTISKNAFGIINENCKYYGSSYAGRSEGTKYLTGISYKTPIIIDESSNIIFFPTCSPKSRGCIWINLSNLKNIEKCGQNVKVNFYNGTSLDIKESYYSIEKQYLKATLLESVYRSKKINKNKR